jgi:hypothetical protein
MLLTEDFAADAALSIVPCEVPTIELEALSARLLALALATEMTLSALP